MDTECVKQLSLILGIIQNEKNNPSLIIFQEVERRKKKDKTTILIFRNTSPQMLQFAVCIVLLFVWISFF